MANNPLGIRQKLTFRLDPNQIKPRNPVALAAKQSAAGSHQNRWHQFAEHKK